MSEIARATQEAELEAAPSKVGKWIAITIGIAIVLVVSVIVVLAMLGPSIGNIFSNTTSYI